MYTLRLKCGCQLCLYQYWILAAVKQKWKQKNNVRFFLEECRKSQLVCLILVLLFSLSSVNRAKESAYSHEWFHIYKDAIEHKSHEELSAWNLVCTVHKIEEHRSKRLVGKKGKYSCFSNAIFFAKPNSCLYCWCRKTYFYARFQASKIFRLTESRKAYTNSHTCFITNSSIFLQRDFFQSHEYHLEMSSEELETENVSASVSLFEIISIVSDFAKKNLWERCLELWNNFTKGKKHSFGNLATSRCYSLSLRAWKDMRKVYGYRKLRFSSMAKLEVQLS